MYTIRISRRSNPSILKEINPEYTLEGPTLTLKLQYFGHLLWRADSMKQTFMLRNIEGKRRRGWQMMTWLDSIANSMNMNLSKLQKIVEDRRAWSASVHEVINSQTWLNDSTAKTKNCIQYLVITCNGKESEEMYVQPNHFAVYLKLTQY